MVDKTLRVLMETSALVAAIVQIHPKHERAFPWLRKAKEKQIDLFVATPTLAELYAVLTTLPLRPRIGPATARRLIREDVELISTVVELRLGDYRRVLNNMSELALTGGVIYDALAARAAQKTKIDKLLTFDVSDFRRVWPDGGDRIQEP
jgi:predicted nucleic acid-binding protein